MISDLLTFRKLKCVHISFYHNFKLRPCGLVIAPELHPLLSETASHVSECLLRRGGWGLNRLMSFCNNWYQVRLIYEEFETSLY